MDFIPWLAETGTNEWVSGFIANNYYILGAVGAVAGAWLKGRYPDFWAKLSTALPFVGEHKRGL